MERGKYRFELGQIIKGRMENTSSQNEKKEKIIRKKQFSLEKVYIGLSE